MNSEILCRGAEAVIILEDNAVIKERARKSYRLKELDEKIRKQRTKSETKLLEKASKIIPVPIPIKSENYSIIMPFIDGKKLSAHLDNFSMEKQKEICKQIGDSVAKLHDSNIIHGDLTTSNMIYVEDYSIKTNKLKSDFSINTSSGRVGGNNRASTNQNFKIIRHEPSSKESFIKKTIGCLYFIDFGLGFISRKIEDKAVDLHLLKQALEAKHFKNWETLFHEILKNYKFKDSRRVIEQLKKVEKRGRYKGNY
ncbi:MAG: RIO1 family regulatory kinase/ATPase [Nanoarchaeota archaeon]